MSGCNFFFVFIFTLEAILKITGLGFQFYWRDDWNKFDFIIVILSLVAVDENMLPIKATVFRVFRIARLFRMIKISKGLNQLFKTLVASIPSLANVGTLLLLLHFIYGVAGMEILNTVPYGDFINEHANFKTFYFSLITLFRCSTGES